MSDAKHPIHRLRDRLVAARLAAIEALSGEEVSEAVPLSDQLRRVAELHLVLTAVREEITRHEVIPGTRLRGAPGLELIRKELSRIEIYIG